MKLYANSLCPCGSGNKYKRCCQPFHKGLLPKNALQLMRSRYCAYYLHNVEYIIKTTHPENKDYTTNFEQWGKDILDFTRNYTFEKLSIIDFIENEKISYVLFHAKISFNNEDHSFTEKSSFKKINNEWRYLNAVDLKSK